MQDAGFAGDLVLRPAVCGFQRQYPVAQIRQKGKQLNTGLSVNSCFNPNCLALLVFFFNEDIF